jgi:formate dehydrogenase alpha subunit
VAGLATSLGAGAATNSLAQMHDIDTIFLFGSNPTEAHPIVSIHLKKALKKGARLVVGDPRQTWMAKRADVWLNLKPATNIALINGIINVILEKGWENKDFINKRTEGFDELRAKVREYDLKTVEKITGVSGNAIVEAARLYSQAKNGMIVYGLGVTEHNSGTENSMAIANLALVCGQIGRPSTGIMALRGQNNVQGASDLGPLPATLPGYQSVTDEKIRTKFEKAWGVTLSPHIGLKSVEMLDEAIKKRFKALFILGEDPAHTDPNVHEVRKALESLDFLVVQVICEIGTRMGYPMHYNHPSEIMDEIASLVPIYGGISFGRLEKESLQWPCPTKDHPGTTTLYTDLFSRPGGLARFIPLDQKPSGETAGKEYPFTLITGRRREHYNNGSMTRRIKEIMAVAPEELIEISPEDARKLKINSGDWVNVSSRRGKIKVRAQVTERAQKGNVFLSFHYQDALTNMLTSEHRDPIVGTPEYKVTAVKIEK